MNRNDLIAGSSALFVTLLILMVTLSPFDFAVSGTLRRLGYKCLFVGVGESSLIDIRNNILLFLPFGLSLAWLKKRVWITGWPDLVVIGLTSFALSYSIEVLQVFLHTRASSLVDVFSNTLGGIVGFFLFGAGRYILSGYSISNERVSVEPGKHNANRTNEIPRSNPVAAGPNPKPVRSRAFDR